MALSTKKVRLRRLSFSPDKIAARNAHFEAQVAGGSPRYGTRPAGFGAAVPGRPDQPKDSTCEWSNRSERPVAMAAGQQFSATARWVHPPAVPRRAGLLIKDGQAGAYPFSPARFPRACWHT